MSPPEIVPEIERAWFTLLERGTVTILKSFPENPEGRPANKYPVVESLSIILMLLEKLCGTS